MNDAATLSVAVMSGKGGVGKSNIALNLGYALSQAGNPLLLMDCDLGLANLDVLLGIAPEGNLQQVIGQGGVHRVNVVGQVADNVAGLVLVKIFYRQKGQPVEYLLAHLPHNLLAELNHEDGQQVGES